jgi:hypothetical protein
MVAELSYCREDVTEQSFSLDACTHQGDLNSMMERLERRGVVGDTETVAPHSGQRSALVSSVSMEHHSRHQGSTLGGEH